MALAIVQKLPPTPNGDTLSGRIGDVNAARGCSLGGVGGVDLLVEHLTVQAVDFAVDAELNCVAHGVRLSCCRMVGAWSARGGFKGQLRLFEGFHSPSGPAQRRVLGTQ